MEIYFVDLPSDSMVIYGDILFGIVFGGYGRAVNSLRYAFGIGTSVAVVVFSVIIARTRFKRLAKKISSSFA